MKYFTTDNSHPRNTYNVKYGRFVFSQEIVKIVPFHGWLGVSINTDNKLHVQCSFKSISVCETLLELRSTANTELGAVLGDSVAIGDLAAVGAGFVSCHIGHHEGEGRPVRSDLCVGPFGGDFFAVLEPKSKLH